MSKAVPLGALAVREDVQSGAQPMPKSTLGQIEVKDHVKFQTQMFF